jgi:hypothetical protein
MIERTPVVAPVDGPRRLIYPGIVRRERARNAGERADDYADFAKP